MFRYADTQIACMWSNDLFPVEVAATGTADDDDDSGDDDGHKHDDASVYPSPKFIPVGW